MSKGTPANDEERLPWLEPYRDAIAAKQKVARRSHGGLVAVAAGLAVLIAAGGGYWLGQRDDDKFTIPPDEVAMVPVTAPPSLPAETVAPPAADAATTAAAPATAASEGTTTTQDGEPPPIARELARAEAATDASRVARQEAVRERALRNLALERDRLREQRVERERIAAAAAAATAAMPRPAPNDRQAYRQWPKMPSPGPAGQVVQLGAFRTEGRALAAYRSRLARYPVLSSMPRVVVPVATKPRGQVLYVLRLGTSSRQQSSIVCRNLRASGDHCIVIG